MLHPLHPSHNLRNINHLTTHRPDEQIMVHSLPYCLVLIVPCTVLVYGQKLRAVKGVNRRQVVVNGADHVGTKSVPVTRKRERELKSMKKSAQTSSVLNDILSPLAEELERISGIDMPTIDMPTIEIPELNMPQVGNTRLSIPEINLSILWDGLWGDRDPPQGDEANPLEYWEQFWWDDLPRRAQNMAEDIGYTQETWDAGDNWPLLGLPWSSLTKRQQRAATFFLWTSDFWDSFSNAVGTAPNLAFSSVQGVYVASIWDDLWWDELPPGVQQYAMSIGYNQILWDDEASLPPLIGTTWSELTSDQQNGAAVFGWLPETWDSFAGGGEGFTSWSSSSSPGVMIDNEGTLLFPQQPWAQWYDQWWEELPAGIQSQFAILGYTEESWDRRYPLPTRNIKWESLTTAQQAAASLLGWSAEAWDSTLISPYDGVEWDELPPVVQGSLTALGHNAHTWEHSIPVSVNSMHWDEMNLAEQSAASLVGWAGQLIDRIPTKSPTASPTLPPTAPPPSLRDEDSSDDSPGYFERLGKLVDVIVDFIVRIARNSGEDGWGAGMPWNNNNGTGLLPSLPDLP